MGVNLRIVEGYDGNLQAKINAVQPNIQRSATRDRCETRNQRLKIKDFGLVVDHVELRLASAEARGFFRRIIARGNPKSPAVTDHTR